MEKLQKEMLEEIKNRLKSVADEFVKSEAAECDEKTKDIVFRAFLTGFYAGMQVLNN